MKTFALGILLLAIQAMQGPPQPPATAQPDPSFLPPYSIPPGSAMNGASVTFDRLPDAGVPVKIRLRGEVLHRIRQSPGDWQLYADGRPLAAALVLPKRADQPEHSFLTLLGTSQLPAGGTEVVLDRGELPQPLNRLAPLFEGSKRIVASVLCEASTDRQAWSSAGAEQVVYQELAKDELLRLCEITCTPTTARYLRLRFSPLGDASVSRVEAWLEPAAMFDMYEVAASLGAPQASTSDGAQLWPVLISDDKLPLTEIEVLANAPGQVRQMRVVGLNDMLQPTRTITEALWSDALEAGSASRSNHVLQLPLDSGGSSWGVLIANGDRPPLALTGVRARAAEVWLCFAMPAAQSLVLWFGEPSAPLSPSSTDPEKAVAVGEASLLNVAQSPAQRATPGKLLTEGLPSGLAVWWPALAYGAGAILALLLALWLLRKPAGASPG